MRRRRLPAYAAVAVSLAVHGLVGLFLLSRRPPASSPRGESVEVAFEALEPPAQPDREPSVGQADEGGGPAPVRPEGKRAAGPRARAGRTPRSGAGDTRGEKRAEGPGGEKGAEGPGASGATGDRFATFRSTRPDLSHVPGLQAPEVKRDLLAAPRVTKKAPTELPGTMRGPGGVTAMVDEDGAIHFREPSATVRGPSETNLGLSGGFDLTDRVMRMAGMDPYAATKRKMAEDTHEQRVCMARRAQHAREAQALLDLSTKVRAIAGRSDWAPEKRRRIIFEIWDECDDESDYAAMARATIAAIIREALPAGSDLAYSPQELLALNSRRSSHLEFAPYVAREAKRPRPAPVDCLAPEGARAAP